MPRPREEDFASRTALRNGTVRALARLAEGRSGVRRKQRTREERAMLERSALASIKWQEEQGGLERTGPRDYVLHPRRR